MAQESQEARISTNAGEQNSTNAGTNSTNAGMLASDATAFNVNELKPGMQKAVSQYGVSPDGKVKFRDLKSAMQDHEAQKMRNVWLRRIAIILFVLLVLQTAATFGVTFWAVTLAKDSQVVDAQNGSPALTANDRKSIMQVAPAKDTAIALKHAVVLDMKHLRAIDEITYTIPKGLGLRHSQNTTVVSEKILSVSKIMDDHPRVVFKTMGGNELILVPGQARMKIGERSITLCGQLSCGSFQVDDPALDIANLDQKLVEILGEEKARRLNVFTDLYSLCSKLQDANGLNDYYEIFRDFVENVGKQALDEFGRQEMTGFVMLTLGLEKLENKGHAGMSALFAAAAYDKWIFDQANGNVVDYIKTKSTDGWKNVKTFTHKAKFIGLIPTTHDRLEVWKSTKAAKQKCVLAFAGSDDPQDFISDMDTRTKSCTVDGITIDGMSSGVCGEFQGLWSETKDRGWFGTYNLIEDVVKDCDHLIAAGHSLGGALAQTFSAFNNRAYGSSNLQGISKDVDEVYVIGPIPISATPLQNGATVAGRPKGCFAGARYANFAKDKCLLSQATHLPHIDLDSCVDFATWLGHTDNDGGAGLQDRSMLFGAGNLWPKLQHPRIDSVGVDIDRIPQGAKFATDKCDMTTQNPHPGSKTKHRQGDPWLHMPPHYYGNIDSHPDEALWA